MSRVAGQAPGGAVAATFALVALGGFGAWAIWSLSPGRAAIHPADSTTTFLVLLVFAVAVERVLEPFRRWLPGAETVAGDRPAAVARDRAGRAVVAWGLA